MASKTSYIPRYLLPQYGALWRTAARSNAFTRPLNAELGQVLVRYASKTAAPKGAPKAISSKPSAAKAAKNSAPTKQPPRTPPTKIQPVTPKTPTSKAAPTSEPTPVASAPKPVSKLAPAREIPVPTKQPVITSKPVDPSKPIVLEKPEKFNPPSHGTRLPRSMPKHYGGGLSEAEFQAQTAKTYPGLPPPPNTWSHWFLNSRGIHLFITLGTLTSLAVYTFMANFNAKSPFADLIPPISEFPRHPFQYIGVVIDVMRMHEEHEAATTTEKRRMRVDDVAKRAEYRKAHGMEVTQGFFSNDKPAPEPEPVPVVEPEAAPTAESSPDGKRKKWLGIF
ncbi:uncharacterized protein GGS22DRAFT_142042 [Annulohypoxylon maeteangense]|uniref:uncharacterized protein n=1 Tax=Annulohypoxylon maeteangense TaxID=1927788 RepID=UPI0020078734|nr:uncharacterized protein GGS22DRAFT_142042 [Annulohypoxylon maeteangense]KAI0885300.1 hypothetical protein GGS22DRAFT_142042 [Annulohypoxylon maeteangense]